MTTGEPLERALRHVLWRIRDYLPDVVVIGGWVPHLYRRHGGFAEWRTTLSGTSEVDVLIAGEMTPTDRPPLATQLVEAGFRQVDGAGAVWENDPATGEKIEFFVPHRGPFATLGKTQAIRSQRGIAAMALDRLEVLAIDVRVLRVPSTGQDGAEATLDVRVPSLGAYLVAKASTFQQRAASSDLAARVRRAKDLVYLSWPPTCRALVVLLARGFEEPAGLVQRHSRILA